MLIFIIIAAAIVLIVLGIVIYVRIKNFKPNPDKAEQLKELNNDLAPAGFAYDEKEDYFYTLRDCWQRNTGYCKLYDEGSPYFNMIMDCEPITFSYNEKRWMIELWKGQYGITTGAEIGIYNTVGEDIQSERFTGTFYEAVSNDEQLDMSFTLFKNGKPLLKRSAHHWWITAFKLGEFSEKDSLTMEAKIKFPTRKMLKAFTEALINIGYRRDEYSVKYKTVTIKYTTPHTKQPASQGGLQEIVVQRLNKTNCNTFKFATARYSDTLDKLEYIKSFMPELYEFMTKSLYAKDFFEVFEWLLKLVHSSDPEKPIYPPKPPCPPKPDCSCAYELCKQSCRQHCEEMANKYGCTQGEQKKCH